MTEREYLNIKAVTLKMIKRLYRKVENDESPSIEALNVALSDLLGNELLNKTKSAKYLGVKVSTFDKWLYDGVIPPGIKEANECIKWRKYTLDEVKERINI